MKNKYFNVVRSRDCGSALLIVLGFLSFMMISAVSFAVYMRIERQASANYRHAASARQMINIALGRSIEDVDYELRHNTDDNFSCKFPLFNTTTPDPDPCRVLTSVTDDTGTDNQNCRVLSFDSLAYIPGMLVNHVRNYAANEANCAQWRAISMPYLNMVGRDAYKEAIVGRYAYACVNVSDMLDANYCGPRSASNLVSIAYLLSSDTERTDFKKKARDNVHYSDLHDFYSCMYEWEVNGSGARTFKSPYHALADPEKKGTATFDDPEMAKHIIMPGVKVKTEPTVAEEGYNLYDPDQEMFVNLNSPNVEFGPATVYNQTATIPSALKKALELSSNDLDANKFYRDSLLKKLLADYVDTDNLPKSLAAPCAELNPLIAQMSAPQQMPFDITVVTKQDGDGKDYREYRVDLSRYMSDKIPFQIETVWPYKYSSLRVAKENYTLEIKAYLKINVDHQAQNSGSFAQHPQGPDLTKGYCIELNGSVAVPNIWQDVNNQDDACSIVNINLTPKLLNPEGPYYKLFDSNGGKYNGFTPGNSISLSLVLSYARVFGADGCVDSVPCATDQIGGVDPKERWFVEKKLFFQTTSLGPINDSTAASQNMLPFEWSCLETADPRFNWKVTNWFVSNVPIVDGKVNDSTEQLTGVDGRDTDMFIGVSNAGVLISPGELGFIVRPFSYNDESNPNQSVDFRTYNFQKFYADRDDNTLKNDCNAMFRTFRLYDHGDPGEKKTRRHDDIYKWFYNVGTSTTKFLKKSRVNPLSDIPEVSKAAIEGLPLDYGVANLLSFIDDASVPAGLLKANYTDSLGGGWTGFSKSWSDTLQSALSPSRNSAGKAVDVFRNFRHGIQDLYPEDTLFHWYNTENDTIFDKKFGFELHEVDRKMLYAYSLDSFSDRQQLFLFFVKAEATAAAFGSRSRSVAGGKAVALVWRDPYPSGYNRPKEPDHKTAYHEHKILYVKYLD